jgi:hypothetical protein
MPTEARAIAGAWERERAAAQTSTRIDWKARWGTSFAAKNAAFELALKAAPDDIYGQLTAAGIRNAPHTVELLVRLGERLRRDAGV